MIAEIEYEQTVQGIDRVLSDVKKQRMKQLERWGIQEHDPKTWYAILGEEFGEIGKEIAEGEINGVFNMAAYREECLHTAAVALAMVQFIDDGAA